MIDRDLQTIIDGMVAMGFAMPEPLDAVTMRAIMDNTMDVEKMPIAQVTDIEVPGGDGPVPARLYNPDPDGTPPVTFLFHGGGWVVGTLDTHDAMARLIARDAGCAVISVQYRLAPENPYPAAFEDCYAAVAAVEALAKEHGLDGDRFAVCGDSAGGNLAAVTTLALAEKGGPRPLRQILIYPVIDGDAERDSHRNAPQLPILNKATMDFFSQSYVGDATPDQYLNPLLAEDLSKVAPAQVIVAGQDPLHDEGEDYAMTMRRAGVSVDFHDFAGAIHGFASFAGMAPLGDAAMALVTARLKLDFAHAA